MCVGETFRKNEGEGGQNLINYLNYIRILLIVYLSFIDTGYFAVTLESEKKINTSSICIF